MPRATGLLSLLALGLLLCTSIPVAFAEPIVPGVSSSQRHAPRAGTAAYPGPSRFRCGILFARWEQ